VEREKNYVTRAACDDPAERDPEDFYPTPEVATRALIRVERFPRTVWEPACGDGAISRVLEAAGHAVLSTDLYDRGYGTTGVDFLAVRDRCENVITNPPFRHAEEFAAHARRLARRKVAMLLRLAWPEGVGRYERIYSKDPPTRVFVFSQRIHFTRGGSGGRRRIFGGMVAFMWMVRDKADTTGRTDLRWIPPEGT
jgi:hypothetical protein